MKLRGWIAASLAAFALSGCVSLQLFGGPPDPLEEKLLQGVRGPKILMLPIDGVLTSQRAEPDLFGSEGDNPVSRVRESLDRARLDPEVRALLLRIDSPGGGATASELIYREIQRFKQERRVPVVAQLMSTAASGGYYVAMAADSIIAHPTTVTGSIGVIFVGVNVAGLMEKLGIEDQTLTSGSQKDAGSALRRMRPEERRHLQSVIDDLHARFREVVLAGRPGLGEDGVAALADGRIFSAAQALERGLVDEVGDAERAVVLVRERAGLAAARVVTYHRPREYANNLLTQPVVPRRISLELPMPLGRLERPGFYYLWAPGLQ